jgi:hypothetical protein
MVTEKRFGNRVIVTSYESPENIYGNDLQELDLGEEEKRSATKAVAVYRLLRRLGVPQKDLADRWGLTSQKVKDIDAYANDNLTKAPETKPLEVARKKVEHITPEEMRSLRLVKNAPGEVITDDLDTAANRYLSQIEGGADEAWLRVVDPNKYASQEKVDTDLEAASYMVKKNIPTRPDLVQAVEEKAEQERKLGLLRKIYRDASKPVPQPRSWFARLLGR